MVNYRDALKENFSLSPSTLEKSNFKNKNSKKILELLDDKISKKYNGIEIGTKNYLQFDSGFYFIKSKSLQSDSFFEVINKESTVNMNKKVFLNYNLKKGDILVSKDSNIGEIAILSRDLKNYMLGGAIYKLPISKNKYYIFAFLKSNYFKQQLYENLPKGATIRHAGTKFLDLKVIFPNYNKGENQKILKLVDCLVLSILDKEKNIRKKNKEIFRLINEEIQKNLYISQEKTLSIKITKLSDLTEAKRLDANYFSKEAKKQKLVIDNYKYGFLTLKQLGYKLKRGQNLQISAIGKSVYSNIKIPNFYTVIKPTNFNEFGTVSKYEYLGNKNNLQTLEEGDIVFSAEGTVGKCVMFRKISEKWITNIHGIILRNATSNYEQSAFVTCMLRFYKEIGYYEYFTVGGQGGSLGKQYWKEILIPNFPDKLRKKIAELYHNKENKLENKITINNFLKNDIFFNRKSGILEINDSLLKTKFLLNDIIRKIVENELINFLKISTELNNIWK